MKFVIEVSILFIFLVSCTTTQKEESRDWEFPMIAKGQNGPSLNVKQYQDVLIKIRNKENSKIDGVVVSALESEGLIRKDDVGNFQISFFSANTTEGEEIYKGTKHYAKDIVGIIKRRMTQIKKEAKKNPVLGQYDFKEVAFYVLSDVLLDDVQIENVEERFLKSKRPFRGKTNYYLAMFERSPIKGLESFGIYGNQCIEYGDIAGCLYGNRRIEKNFWNMSSEELVKIFPEHKNLIGKVLKETILKKFVEVRKKSPCEVTENFHSINLECATPIFSENDYNSLNKLAKIIESELIAYLQSKKTNLETDWKNSRYVKETTFEEYFIWWYHFLYTDVTNQLAQDGLLKIPSSGNFHYIVRIK